MGLKINFSESKVASFDPIPRGTYNATVYEAKMGETKGGGVLPAGTPKVDVQFRISGTDTAGKDYENRRQWKTYVIPPTEIDGEPYKNHDNLMDQLFTFYAAIGYTQDEIKKWKALPDMEELAGRECRIQVGLREYEGETQNEVKSVKPAGSADSITVGSGLKNL